jgi:ABC-type amino acid transport substrate-binding protein
MTKNRIMNGAITSAVCLVIALAATAVAAVAAPLDKIKSRGYIEIAVYERFIPYSYEENGQPTGVDVEIGRALAEKLGVNAKFRLFQPDESADDDLRNHVWKGHPINGAPADVMLHVPTHPNFANENKQVKILTPYFRETEVVARYPRLKQAVSIANFSDERIGAEKLTLASDYLAAAMGGMLRESMALYPNVAAAVADLKAEKISAILGPRGELEGYLGADLGRFVVGPVAMPGLAYNGWDLGVAVPAKETALAEAVEKAMAELEAEGTIKRIFVAHGLTYFEPETLLAQH